MYAKEISSANDNDNNKKNREKREDNHHNCNPRKNDRCDFIHNHYYNNDTDEEE